DTADCGIDTCRRQQVGAVRKRPVAQQIQVQTANLGVAAEQQVGGVGNVETSAYRGGTQVEVAGKRHEALFRTQPGIAGDGARQFLVQAKRNIDALAGAAHVSAHVERYLAASNGGTLAARSEQVAIDVEVHALAAEQAIESQVASLVDMSAALRTRGEFTGNRGTDGRLGTADVAIR